MTDYLDTYSIEVFEPENFPDRVMKIAKIFKWDDEERSNLLWDRITPDKKIPGVVTMYLDAFSHHQKLTPRMANGLRRFIRLSGGNDLHYVFLIHGREAAKAEATKAEAARRRGK